MNKRKEDRANGMRRHCLPVLTKVAAVSAALLISAFASVPQASASVIGNLNFANCGGQGVIVNATTIDWLPGPASGCINAGAGTTIAFSGGSIALGETGTINDLNSATPGVGNTGFISFTGVSFNLALTSPGPGVSNTVCSTTSTGPACSVAAGSPFILTPTTTGTSIVLDVNGLAKDATSSNSVWSGIFSTQVASETPAQIQAAIIGGGSVTSTYAFSGVSAAGSVIPEPVTSLLIGGGLIALAGLKLRKSRS